MKIIGAAWHGFGVPFRAPYLTSGAEAQVRYGLLLFLLSDNGLMGIGEASPVGAGSKKEIEETASLIDCFAPQVLQIDLDNSESLQRLWVLPLPTFVRFGIETALLDLKGKASGCSAVELLGGKPLPLPVNALITTELPQEAAAKAREAVALGFTSLKLKVALGSIEQDEALVSSVRQAVGPKVKLRIDPNQEWSVSQAIDSIHRLAPYGLEYVEQPVLAEDIAGLNAVRMASSVLIAADEALGSIDDLERLVEEGAVDLFIVKAGRLGGVEAAKEVMRLAEKAGKPVVVTSSLESGVGLAASVHLAATLPSHSFAHGLATGLLLENDLLTSPLLPSNGMISVPKGNGLGVDLDMRAVDKYSIGIKGWVGSWQRSTFWPMGLSPADG